MNGPWQIPQSWAWAESGEIAEIGGGGTPRTDDPSNFDGGNVPWITPADLSGYKNKYIARGARNITRKGLDNSGARLMPEGTVLFSSRAPIGYVAIASNPVSTNQGFKSFVLCPDIKSDYAYYYLQRAKTLAVELSSGTTFREISGAKAALIPFPVAPIAEQERIVAEMEKQFTRLDAAVAALKRVQANLKRYRAAVLKAACEGRLVPTEAELAGTEKRPYETASVLLERILAERRSHWEEEQLSKLKSAGKRPPRAWQANYKEPTITTATDLSLLPEGWCWTNILALVPPERSSVKTGPFGSLLKKHEHRREGVSVFGIENIDRMRFLPGSKIFISQEKARELSDYDAKPGDVLISRSGTVGEVCVVPQGIGDARISTNLMRIRLASNAMTPQFLCLLFNGSPFVLKQISTLCSGSTRDFLNNEILLSLVFPLPPLSEQGRIISEIERRLSVIQETETQLESDVRRSERLRQGILKHAFEGTLVPQDPSDEPASVLLERIRTERETESLKSTKGARESVTK